MKKTLKIIPLLGAFSVLVIGCAVSNMPVGGPIPHTEIKDGLYEGHATQGPVKAVARVTIKNKQIKGIELKEHRTLKGKSAENVIPARIIQDQSTNVDGVSGATMSSIAIMNAVEAAIQKAK